MDQALSSHAVIHRLSYKAPNPSTTAFFSVILSCIFPFSIHRSIGSSIRSPVITNVAIISYVLINKSFFDNCLPSVLSHLAPTLSVLYCWLSSPILYSFLFVSLVLSGDGIC